MQYARSLKSADSAADRRIIAAVNADNGAPTREDQAIPVGLFGAIDCVAKCTGAGGSYVVRVWWYYQPCDEWVLDDDIGGVAVSTAGGNEQFPILNNANTRCATGVYLQVDTFAGGGVANCWLVGRDA
jgi:hypothetical protein